MRGSDLNLDAGQTLELAYQAMTPEGTIARGSFHAVTLDFAPEARARIARDGLSTLGRLELPAGRHQVRFAVHQPGGKTGLAIADVEIPDYSREPMEMSGLVIAFDETAADRTVLSDARLKSILGANPTVRRRFSRTDTLTAFAELYADRLMPQLRVTATLTTERGDTVRRETVKPTTSAPGAVGYTVRTPLADLKPGPYVLTFEARAGRFTTMRQVRLVVGDSQGSKSPLIQSIRPPTQNW